jgi:hypothetical protein|tara:strand:+ start:129 stop:743 length:615 start_codon:yes stop_codon:yes gene_type:complete
MDTSSTFFSFYFMLGLLAVIVFFLSAAMVGFALFSHDMAARFKLIRIQSVLFTLELAVLVYVSRDVSATLASMPVEPTLLQIGDVSRESMSFLLLGLSLVFSGLLTAFAWIKCGRANAAFAALICTIFVLKVTLASLTLLDVLGRAANPARENGIGTGEFGSTMQQAFTDISSSFSLWLPIMAALLGLSAYFRIRDRAKNRANY